MQQEQDEIMASGRFLNYKFYLRQRPVILTLMTALAIACFVGVTGLSRAYQEQRDFLGNRWFNRGVADLKAQHYDAAVTEFRAALLYSRDNYSYQLNLAEALIGAGHMGEASAYLLNLWDREPEDGLVNLELARIAKERGQAGEAVRYYHGAVYAEWPSDQENMRRQARLELIQLLLETNAKPQAQAELIALSENVGADPAQQEQVGQLFLRAGDYEHALAAFEISLKTDRHNAEALAGAGESAFELQRFGIAKHYLEEAIAENPKDVHSEDNLKTAELVLHMDPFQREISAAERNRMVVDAFETAGKRLESCAIPTSPGGPPNSLSESWNSMKPQITERGLQRDPDLADSAMDLVFRIERQANVQCSAPTGADQALVLIAKLHEGY